MFSWKKANRIGMALHSNNNYENRCKPDLNYFLGISQIRQLKPYPCNISFAKSLRTDSENYASTSICLKKDNENCEKESYSTVNLPRIINKCYNSNKPEALNDLIGARRCRSSLDPGLQKTNKSILTVEQNNTRTETPKVRFVTRKSKMVNNIYEILRQVDDESTYTEIPMRKRKKKWIRSIHDLL